MPTKFRFRWIPFVAALVAAAVGVSLGQWQTRRAAEKEAIEAKLVERESAAPLRVNAGSGNVDEIEFRQVQAVGQFVSGWTVFIDNRPHKGEAGFYVLTPMRLTGSDMHVLVARGWARRDVTDRAKVPAVAVPEGDVEVAGIARRRTGHVLQLGSPVPVRPGAIVQNLEIAELAQAANIKMLPFVIEQTTELPDGLVRDWPRPSTGVEKHRGYAFQWYALAATALLFFVVTGFRREAK